MEKDLKKKITITVTGQPGVGKSAVAQKITEFLNEMGIPADVNFILDEHEPRTAEKLGIAIDAVKDHGVYVEVNESIQKRLL